MSEDHAPQPEPRGDLVPPPRIPPTAVAAGTPQPDPGEESRAIAPVRAWRPPGLRARAGVLRAVDRVLDALDETGDAIAEAIGLR